jgi:hypothetical protein
MIDREGESGQAEDLLRSGVPAGSNGRASACGRSFNLGRRLMTSAGLGMRAGRGAVCMSGVSLAGHIPGCGAFRAQCDQKAGKKSFKAL